MTANAMEDGVAIEKLMIKILQQLQIYFNNSMTEVFNLFCNGDHQFLMRGWRTTYLLAKPKKSMTFSLMGITNF